MKDEPVEEDEHVNTIESKEAIGKPTRPIGPGVPVLNSSYPRRNAKDEPADEKSDKDELVDKLAKKESK